MLSSITRTTDFLLNLSRYFQCNPGNIALTSGLQLLFHLLISPSSMWCRQQSLLPSRSIPIPGIAHLGELLGKAACNFHYCVTDAASNHTDPTFLYLIWWYARLYFSPRRLGLVLKSIRCFGGLYTDNWPCSRTAMFCCIDTLENRPSHRAVNCQTKAPRYWSTRIGGTELFSTAVPFLINADSLCRENGTMIASTTFFNQTSRGPLQQSLRNIKISCGFSFTWSHRRDLHDVIILNVYQYSREDGVVDRLFIPTCKNAVIRSAETRTNDTGSAFL